MSGINYYILFSFFNKVIRSFGFNENCFSTKVKFKAPTIASEMSYIEGEPGFKYVS